MLKLRQNTFLHDLYARPLLFFARLLVEVRAAGEKSRQKELDFCSSCPFFHRISMLSEGIYHSIITNHPARHSSCKYIGHSNTVTLFQCSLY